MTATTSIGAMPAPAIAAMCDASARIAKMPPWTPGWSVLTRPESISGKPVRDSTVETGRPAAERAAAEPPVETRS